MTATVQRASVRDYHTWERGIVSRHRYRIRQCTCESPIHHLRRTPAGDFAVLATCCGLTSRAVDPAHIRADFGSLVPPLTTSPIRQMTTAQRIHHLLTRIAPMCEGRIAYTHRGNWIFEADDDVASAESRRLDRWHEGSIIVGWVQAECNRRDWDVTLERCATPGGRVSRCSIWRTPEPVVADTPDPLVLAALSALAQALEAEVTT